MNIQKFINQRPYLYHLTSEINAANIIASRRLYSANNLISMSGDIEAERMKREKRTEHFELIINGQNCLLRDQRPISEKTLAKCLTDNWKVEDFLYHLNERVFMWPTINRLSRHFKRYEPEKPVILRFSTEEMISVNSHVKFCRLNSGATRANSYLGGKAPDRGPGTFVSASDFTLPVSDVAEVTFENSCIICGDIGLGYHPDSSFK